METKEITLKDVLGSIDTLAMATKNSLDTLTNDIHEFKSEMYEFKDDMLGFKYDVLGFQHETTGTLVELSNKLETVDGRLYNIEKTLEPIALAYPMHTRELQSLNSRVTTLEHQRA